MAGEQLRFVTQQQVADIHEKLLARDGGLAGYRLGASLESVLARVRNNIDYNGTLYAEPRKVAALVTYALVIGHPFLDGNKRTALTVGIVVLQVNGVLEECGLPDPGELAQLLVAAAAKKISQEAFIEAYMRLLDLTKTAKA